MAMIALCAIVVIAYGNMLGNGFVWDDNQQIAMNPDLRGGSSWTKLFSSDVWDFTHPDQPVRSNDYRPLQMLCYRAVSESGSPKPWNLHLLSLIFALTGVLAAFLVYLRLSTRVLLAFAAATLFAVHPAHTEAVDWISALPDIGCTVFILFSFRLFLSLDDSPGRDTHH